MGGDSSGGTSSGGTAAGGTSSGGTGTGGNVNGTGGFGGSAGGTAGTGGEGGFGGEDGLGGEGGDSTVVSACEASLDGIEGCDLGRQCNYQTAAAYCSEGNATATLAFSACFQLGTGCHTPADPGTDAVVSCYEAVLDAEGTDTSTGLRALADDLCELTDWEPLMLEVYAAMAGDEIAEGFVECVEDATECYEIPPCVFANLGVPMPPVCQ